MSRKARVIGAKICVDVERPWQLRQGSEEREKHYLEAAVRLESTLKKLLRADLFSGESVYSEMEVEAVCSFCGRAWTEGKKDPHNGGCCDEDAKAMPEEVRE